MNKLNILEQIGSTPLIKLRSVNETRDVDIYVKCEFLNPGGSIKDRMALGMIEAAVKGGAFKPDGTIIDQSTGNTGPAPAKTPVVAQVYRHAFFRFRSRCWRTLARLPHDSIEHQRRLRLRLVSMNR